MLFECPQKCNEKGKICNKNDRIWRENIEGTVFRKEHRESDFFFWISAKGAGWKNRKQKGPLPGRNESLPKQRVFL